MKTFSFFILLLAIVFGQISALADDASNNQEVDAAFFEEKVTLDGKEYSRYELIYDFVNIAISETLWQENSSKPSHSIYKFIEILRDRHEREKNSSYKNFHNDYFGWLAPYLHRYDKLPLHSSIHKWENEDIFIGLGFPEYKYTIGDPFSIYDTRTREHKPEYQLLSELTKDIVNQLNDHLPVKVGFLDSENPQEKTDDYAKIRFLIGDGEVKNFFKFRQHLNPNPNPLPSSRGHSYFFDRLEKEDILGAIPFTPNSRSQVEGYFIPNLDNSIGISFCKFSKYLFQNKANINLIKSLITECIVRSLGLSDVSHLANTGYLEEWNTAFDSISLRGMYDGVKVLMWKPPTDQTASFRNQQDLKDYIDSFQIIVSETNQSFTSLSEYDQYMVNLLYCDAISSGMTKHEVIVTLLENPQCL